MGGHVVVNILHGFFRRIQNGKLAQQQLAVLDAAQCSALQAAVQEILHETVDSHHLGQFSK